MIRLLLKTLLALAILSVSESQKAMAEDDLHVPCEFLLDDQLPPELPHSSVALREEDIRDEMMNSEEVPCVNGFADGYPCENVNLLSMLDTSALNVAIGATGGPGDLLSDVWGWTDTESGREFALVCMRRGTAFVEITNPTSPVYLGVLKAHNNGNSSWRDIKTYSHYAYIVSEQYAHGMQVFDLNILLTASPNTVFSETTHYSAFSNCHNIFINEQSGYAYAVGTDTCNGGLHMINLSVPDTPSEAGCYGNDGYTHDVQCVIYEGSHTEYQGREICFASNEDTITIVDATNKDSPVLLSRMGYDGSRYTHQGWLTEDHNYFMFNDELDEYNGATSKTKSFVANVMDLNNPEMAGYHLGTTTAIDHNMYIRGSLVYEANYRAGLQVLEINDISTADMTQVAMFDVYPDSDSANFNGAWSNYPFFPSGNVIVTGIEQGLFILHVDYGQVPTESPVSPPSPPSTPGPTISPTASPPTNAPTPCTGSSFELLLTTDDYPTETSWTLLNECTNQEESQGGPYEEAGNYVEELCIPSGEYTFTIHDSYGDGICCSYGSGSYTLKYNGNVVKEGGTFTEQESTTFGSCVPTTSQPVSPPTSGPDSCVNFKIALTTDHFGYETSITLINQNYGKIRLFGGDYASDASFEETACLTNGRYLFTISDSYGNGICCNEGNGSYSLTLDGETVKQGGQFGESETVSFDVGPPGPTSSPTQSPTCLPAGFECVIGDHCCNGRCFNGSCI